MAYYYHFRGNIVSVKFNIKPKARLRNLFKALDLLLVAQERENAEVE